MTNNIKESFEKSRIAGSIAAEALDEYLAGRSENSARPEPHNH